MQKLRSSSQYLHIYLNHAYREIIYNLIIGIES